MYVSYSEKIWEKKNVLYTYIPTECVRDNESAHVQMVKQTDQNATNR